MKKILALIFFVGMSGCGLQGAVGAPVPAPAEEGSVGTQIGAEYYFYQGLSNRQPLTGPTIGAMINVKLADELRRERRIGDDGNLDLADTTQQYRLGARQDDIGRGRDRGRLTKFKADRKEWHARTVEMRYEWYDLFRRLSENRQRYPYLFEYLHQATQKAPVMPMMYSDSAGEKNVSPVGPARMLVKGARSKVGELPFFFCDFEATLRRRLKEQKRLKEADDPSLTLDFPGLTVPVYKMKDDKTYRTYRFARVAEACVGRMCFSELIAYTPRADDDPLSKYLNTLSLDWGKWIKIGRPAGARPREGVLAPEAGLKPARPELPVGDLVGGRGYSAALREWRIRHRAWKVAKKVRKASEKLQKKGRKALEKAQEGYDFQLNAFTILNTNNENNPLSSWTKDENQYLVDAVRGGNLVWWRPEAERKFGLTKLRVRKFGVSEIGGVSHDVLPPGFSFDTPFPLYIPVKYGLYKLMFLLLGLDRENNELQPDMPEYNIHKDLERLVNGCVSLPELSRWFTGGELFDRIPEGYHNHPWRTLTKQQMFLKESEWLGRLIGAANRRIDDPIEGRALTGDERNQRQVLLNSIGQLSDLFNVEAQGIGADPRLEDQAVYFTKAKFLNHEIAEVLKKSSRLMDRLKKSIDFSIKPWGTYEKLLKGEYYRGVGERYDPEYLKKYLPGEAQALAAMVLEAVHYLWVYACWDKRLTTGAKLLRVGQKALEPKKERRLHNHVGGLFFVKDFVKAAYVGYKKEGKGIGYYIKKLFRAHDKPTTDIRDTFIEVWKDLLEALEDRWKVGGGNATANKNWIACDGSTAFVVSFDRKLRDYQNEFSVSQYKTGPLDRQLLKDIGVTIIDSRRGADLNVFYKSGVMRSSVEHGSLLPPNIQGRLDELDRFWQEIDDNDTWNRLVENLPVFEERLRNILRGQYALQEDVRRLSPEIQEQVRIEQGNYLTTLAQALTVQNDVVLANNRLPLSADMNVEMREHIPPVLLLLVDLLLGIDPQPGNDIVNVMQRLPDNLRIYEMAQLIIALEARVGAAERGLTVEQIARLALVAVAQVELEQEIQHQNLQNIKNQFHASDGFLVRIAQALVTLYPADEGVPEELRDPLPLLVAALRRIDPQTGELRRTIREILAVHGRILAV